MPREDIARSLVTLIAANCLIFSNVIAQIEGIKRVCWIGNHIMMNEYMKMSEEAFSMISENEAELIFSTYSNFLGSFGLLLSATRSEYQYE